MDKKMIFSIVVVLAFTHSISSSAEWRFRSQTKPNETTFFLSESPSMTKGCEGKNEASEQIYVLEKWTFLRELCYQLDKNEVKFVDPSKVMFFNSFARPASNFVKIKTSAEVAEIEGRQRMNEMIRETNEMLRQSREEQKVRQSQRRLPIICTHIGDMSVCD